MYKLHAAPRMHRAPAALGARGLIFLHTPRQFSPIAHNPGHLLCDFWTAGFTPRPPDIGSARCTPLFQVSNRTIECISDRSARLYGDCMGPDRMAKYSLPVLTDLTENLIQKKQLFMC
jgi:hypothetical protein